MPEHSTILSGASLIAMGQVETVMETLESRLASEFQFYLRPGTKRVIRFSESELISEEKLDELFALLSDHFPGPKAVQASMFSKYYSKIFTGAALFAMSRYDKALNVSPQHVLFETDLEWNPIISLYSGSLIERRFDREQWREQLVRHIFTDHLSRVFNSLHRYSGIGLKVLWANISNYVYYYYPHWIEYAPTEAARGKIEDDFDYLTKDVKKEIFGCNPYENPLTVQYKHFQHPVFEKETVRVRETCCLKHCLKDGAYCTTCPKLDDKSRADLLIKHSS
jgi:ferric iron reductase protein FhuF